MVNFAAGPPPSLILKDRFMKLVKYLFLMALLGLSSCKKTTVDGSSIKAFQSSINDISAKLSTLQQIKLNEALYIIKKFGVEAEGDINEINAMAKLLEGKNATQILALADALAIEHNMDWSSTAPPSLGNTNIFQNTSAKERDKNDIDAKALNMTVTPVRADSLSGVTALRVTPVLLDGQNQPIEFDEASLETSLEVRSNDKPIYTAKSFIEKNPAKPFTIKFAALPAEDIMDGMISIKITVKTTKKLLQFTKMNVAVNAKALKVKAPEVENIEPIDTPALNPDSSEPKADPKQTVNEFIGHLNASRLQEAYALSDNPNWGSYDNFANPNSGFGAVKSVSLKSMQTLSNSGDKASIKASYTVLNQQGQSANLEVIYQLKSVDQQWKISNYSIK
jgi:hypothetical protein